MNEMKIKIHGERDYINLKRAIIFILFSILIAWGAFGWGYIYRDYRADDLREKVHRIEMKERDLSGRITALETLSHKKK